MSRMINKSYSLPESTHTALQMEKARRGSHRGELSAIVNEAVIAYLNLGDVAVIPVDVLRRAAETLRKHGAFDVSAEIERRLPRGE